MKIGLALSGGGALGAAHIGVLEELEKNQIRLNHICGTSAGAIVGLLYADGGLEEIADFFTKLENAGLFKAANLLLHRNTTIFEEIKKNLKLCVKAKGFSDLKINFSCVATDINLGELVILSSGDPIDAAMASAAYPGVFPSQEINGKTLIDGGLMRNLPAGPLRDQGADFVIGSSLYSLTKFEDIDKKLKNTPLGVAVRAIDILQKNLSEYEKKNCNFCFLPPIEDYSWYNFNHIHEIREAGRKYAVEKMPELVKIIKPLVEKNFWQNFLG